MTQPSRAEIQERALAQPCVHDGEVIDFRNALALFDELEHKNPILYAHINAQIDEIDGFWKQVLGSEISPNIRRQIVARAAIAGATQVLSDTGQSLRDVETFKHLLGIKSETIPVTETEPPPT